MSTFVIFKDYGNDLVEELQIRNLLNNTENLIDVRVGVAVPLTANALELEVLNFNEATVQLKVKGGHDNITYGADLYIQTDEREISALLAFVVKAQASLLNPYTSVSPDAFKGLIGEVQAGSTVVGKAKFSLTEDKDPTGGFITYELLTQEDEVISSGNCFSFNIRDIGNSKIVTGESVVTIPHNLVPTAEGESYQIRWSLYANEEVMHSFETVTIAGDATVPLGTQPMVELAGNHAKLELVTEELYDEVTLQLYGANKAISDAIPMFSNSVPSLSKPYPVPGGYLFAGVIPTTDMEPSLVPYSFIWRYWYSAESYNTYTERDDLWITTPSVLSAAEDVLAKVNKARTTLYGKPDLLYPIPTIMTWLRRAMDAFNGYQGRLTRFTMLNATGVVREYWLMFAELFAIESQFLAEGEKAFDFQGEAISLTVDRTQYLETAAANLRDRINNELPGVKKNLIIKGLTGGDGDVADLGSKGNMGAVGINITPASIWNTILPNIHRR